MSPRPTASPVAGTPAPDSPLHALKAEGVRWQGPILLVGAEHDLPLILVVTNQRIAMLNIGHLALDFPLDWLAPAPTMLAENGVRLTISPDGNAAKATSMVIRAREGRGAAASLVATLTGAATPDDGLSTPNWNMSVGAARAFGMPPIDETPAETAPKLTSWPPSEAQSVQPPTAEPQPPARKTPSAATAPWRVGSSVPVPTPVPAAVSRAARTSGTLPDGRTVRDDVPAPGSTPRVADQRHHRQARLVAWLFRGLLVAVLIAIGVLVQERYNIGMDDIRDQLPTSLQQRLGIERPQDEATVTDAPARITDVAQARQPEPTAEPTPEPTARPTEAPTAAPTEEPTAAPTEEPTRVAVVPTVEGPRGGPTSALPRTSDADRPTAEPTGVTVGDTFVEPTAEPTEAVVVDEPTAEPTEAVVVDEPTAEPTEAVVVDEPTAEPTEAVVVDEPTAEPTEAVVVDEPTAEPTEAVVVDEPTAEPTEAVVVDEPAAEPTEAVVVDEPTAEPTEATVADETVEAVPSTPTADDAVAYDPTAPVPTAVPEPTQGPPAQAPSVVEGAFPAQAINESGFRYTITGSSVGPTVPELPQVANISGVGQWVVLTMHAQNMSAQEMVFDMSAFVLYADGQPVRLSADTAAVNEMAGNVPAWGPTDAVVWAPGEEHTVTLIYQVPAWASSFVMQTGANVIDLDPVVSSGSPLLADVEIPPSEMLQGTVTDVIDGETIIAAVDGQSVTIRYLSLDTPTGAVCGAEAATARNRELVLGQTVLIERQATDTDARGHWVRDVWVVNDDGSQTLVAQALVREGLARADISQPNSRFLGWLTASQSMAQNESLGVWSACPLP